MATARQTVPALLMSTERLDLLRAAVPLLVHALRCFEATGIPMPVRDLEAGDVVRTAVPEHAVPGLLGADKSAQVD